MFGHMMPCWPITEQDFIDQKYNNNYEDDNNNIEDDDEW